MKNKTDLLNLKTVLDDGGIPQIQHILDIMNQGDEAAPLRKTKNDSLTIDYIMELERHAELGNNLITTNYINKIHEAEEKIEKRKIIDKYIQNLNDCVTHNNGIIKEINDEMIKTQDQIKMFNEIHNHLSDNGHLLTLMTILEKSDIENNSILTLIKKGEDLKKKIIDRYESKLIVAKNKIIEINCDNELINAEIELIRAYDLDTNYLNFDDDITNTNTNG